MEDRKRPNIMVKCDRCGRTAFGCISLIRNKETGEQSYLLEGVVIPFTPELGVELMRRDKNAMCVPCWEGKPIPAPIPRTKIYTGDDL